MAGSYWQRISTERLGRRRLLRSGAALSMGSGAALALAACGGGTKKNAATQPGQATGAASGQEQPRRGGRFTRDLLSTSENFNVLANYQEGYNLSGENVYDRLVTAHPDAKRYHLEAAASVEQPEPTRIVFKLKPGMVYQNLPPINGRPVKAGDIVAVQNFVRTLAKAENPGFQKNFLDRAEAPDDQTVVYVLKKPNAYLFATTQLCNPTGQPIIPQELLDNLDTNKPVGSGAYQLADFQMNNRYLYKRFDGYREAAKGLPYIDEHQVLLINDPVASESAVRSGQTDQWSSPPPGQVDKVVSDMGNKIVDEKYLSPGQFNFDLQMQKAPWNDPRVREAIYRVTNRKQFVDLVFNGKAVVPAGPIMAGLKDYQLDPKETEPYFKNDVAEAKKLLSAAGWDSSKEYEISINNMPNNTSGGQVWQQQLATAGIKVRPVALPFAEWLPNRVGPGKFDLIIGAQPGGDTPYRAMRNHHSDTLDVYSHVGLYDKDIDAMIEKAEVTLDYQENVKLVKQIELEILKRYTGHYIIVTQQMEILRSARLRNYEVDVFQGQVFRPEMWIAG